MKNSTILNSPKTRRFCPILVLNVNFDSSFFSKKCRAKTHVFYRPFFTVRGFPKKGPKTGLSIGKKQLPPPLAWRQVAEGGWGGWWWWWWWWLVVCWWCAGGVLGLKNLVSIYFFAELTSRGAIFSTLTVQSSENKYFIS